MSEFYADVFANKPDWTQGMLVLPDLVCVDLRLWISSNRGKWSQCSQVAVGLDRELAHLAVGPEMPFKTVDELAHSVDRQAERLLRSFVEPFPPINRAG